MSLPRPRLPTTITKARLPSLPSSSSILSTPLPLLSRLPYTLPRMSSTCTKRPPRNVAALFPPTASLTTLYCHTCGRITTPRKSHLKALRSSTPPKYCSDRCRREKPPSNANAGGAGQGIEAEIERTFVDMLGGGNERDAEGGEHGNGDGANRRIVLCSAVEARIFKDNPSENRNDVLPPSHSDSDDSSDGGVPLPSSVFPTIPSAAAQLNPQQLGRQRAANREKVRQAARRGVAFGFPVVQGQEQEQRRRKVEAVQGGRVVEASFAKGEWGVRWRE